MAELYPGRTNQALAFVRFGLQDIQVACDTQDWSRNLRLRAACEATLAHLLSCYRAYLFEIAEQHRLQTVGVVTAASLSEQLAATGQATAELIELETLLSERESWLNLMLSAAEAIHKPTVAQSGEESASEINLVNTTQKSLEERLQEDLPNWYQALQELINRHRETNQEW
jgi:hypothetical protein